MLTSSLGLFVASWLSITPDLERGERLFEQFKYAEARVALTRARAASELERKSLLRILELAGVAAGQLRQSTAAEAAFRELLVLDPNYPLSAEYAPRVTTPFLAARSWVASHGALEAEPHVKANPGRVEAIGLRVKGDPLGLVKRVRLHLEEAGAWRVVEGDIAAVAELGQPDVRWWGELLGERGVQLLLVGSPDSPRIEAAPRPVALTPTPAPTPVLETSLRWTPKRPWARPASYVALGAGAAAAGVGAYFGVRSASNFAAVAGAEKDADGRVVGLTERDADALLASGRASATVANALFVSGAALGVVGVVLFALGSEVQVAPAPSGVIVAGVF